MSKIIFRLGVTILVMAYASVFVFVRLDPMLLKHLAFVPAIGVLGATIANTSGTGGGVVFVPVFNILRHVRVMSLDRVQVVAASFLIQSFGMSMGALRWGTGIYASQAPDGGIRVRDFWRIVVVVASISIPVMLATQQFAHFDPHHVLVAFKVFSITLGVALIATTWTINHTRAEQTQLQRLDLLALIALSMIGGFVTALFSVGIGELVALYLFIRNYPLVTSTGSAVIVSSLSMLAGAPFHILAGHVRWEVVMLAAPGALLGAFFARSLALWLGSKRLKTADGLWIILSSVYLIVLNI